MHLQHAQGRCICMHGQELCWAGFVMLCVAHFHRSFTGVLGIACSPQTDQLLHCFLGSVWV